MAVVRDKGGYCYEVNDVAREKMSDLRVLELVAKSLCLELFM